MPSVSVSAGRLNYAQIAQRGSGPRRDLVLCHGLASSMGFWPLDLLDRLSLRFRLTIFDQRGHGRSVCTPTGYTASALGRDLLSLVDTLNLRKPHVVAHSFGGVAALSALVAEPGRFETLALLDTHIYLGRLRALASGASVDAKLSEALEKAGITHNANSMHAGIDLITALARKVIEDGAIVSDDRRVQFLARSCPKPTAMRWIRLMEETSARSDFERFDGLLASDLSKIETSTYALYGSNSHALHTGTLLKSALGDCTLDTIEGAGHFFVVTRAQEVTERFCAHWGFLNNAAAEVA